MNDRKNDITGNLCRIAGITEPDEKFGEPFIKAFSMFAPQSHDEILVASYTCTLFLSVFFNNFPTEKLHTFVHYTKEHYSRFSFNCKMYEEIFSHMNEDDLKAVVLLDKERNFILRQCSKQDIFEAFDFYTNT